jgi:hypothetical protein
MTIVLRLPLSRKCFRHSAFDASYSGVSAENRKPTTNNTAKTMPAMPPQRSPVSVPSVLVTAISHPSSQQAPRQDRQGLPDRSIAGPDDPLESVLDIQDFDHTLSG